VSGLVPLAGRLAQPAELGDPVGHVAGGHEQGEPAVTRLGGDADGARSHRRDPDGQVGWRRLPEADRPGSLDAVQPGRLAGEQATDLGGHLAQLVGRVGEGMPWNPSTSALVLAPSPST
jgi:hypothetical protein